MQPDFDKMDGLIPAIVQDSSTHRVLMLGYMNEEAYRHTLDSGNVTFYSRSRQTLWTKGETSGHLLRLKETRVDCDLDALLVLVEPVGPGVCHEGYESCFYRTLKSGEWVIEEAAAFEKESVYGVRA